MGLDVRNETARFVAFYMWHRRPSQPNSSQESSPAATLPYNHSARGIDGDGGPKRVFRKMII